MHSIWPTLCLTVLHSQWAAPLEGISLWLFHHIHSAFLSLLCILVHECRAWRYAQSQHPHFPLAPTFTHTLACTVLFYFASTKQIPVQAYSLSHTCFMLQPHTYLSLLQALTMKSLIFCYLLTFTECSFSYSLTSSVSGLHTHAFLTVTYFLSNLRSLNSGMRIQHQHLPADFLALK